MITLYQIDSRAIRHDAVLLDLYHAVTFPGESAERVRARNEAISKLVQAGAYKNVATIASTNLEDAYGMTQNIPPQPSWSMMPHATVNPTGDGYTFMDISQARADEMRREARVYASEMTAKDRELDALRESLTIKLTKDGVAYERQPFGYKSTSMGDLMVLDGTVSVVASFGFDVVGALALAILLDDPKAA